MSEYIPWDQMRISCFTLTFLLGLFLFFGFMWGVAVTDLECGKLLNENKKTKEGK
jgi:hypothetical protein